MSRHLIFAVAALILWPVSSFAQSLVTDQAWVRLPPPVMDSTAAYMVVANPGDQEVVLIAVDSPVAGHVMMHGMQMSEGRMHMFPLPEVHVPAHASVSFEPGGMHIMLMGLHEPLRAGQSVHFEFKTSAGELLPVDAVVRDMRK